MAFGTDRRDPLEWRQSYLNVPGEDWGRRGKLIERTHNWFPLLKERIFLTDKQKFALLALWVGSSLIGLCACPLNKSHYILISNTIKCFSRPNGIDIWFVCTRLHLWFSFPFLKLIGNEKTTCTKSISFYMKSNHLIKTINKTLENKTIVVLNTI